MGILFSVGMGNNYNADACLYFPAASPQTITVAASNQYENFASFSNTGPCVNIIGPDGQLPLFSLLKMYNLLR